MNASTSVIVSLGCMAKGRMSENLIKFSQSEEQNKKQQTNKTTATTKTKKLNIHSTLR